MAWRSKKGDGEGGGGGGGGGERSFGRRDDGGAPNRLIITCTQTFFSFLITVIEDTVSNCHLHIQ